MKVARWMSYDAADDMPESVGGLGGWFNAPRSNGGMRWKDFIESVDESHRHYYEALREEILRLNLRRGGDWHQSEDDGVPVFEDGTVATFSYRAWGDLLAAVWSEADGVDHSYMDFYMDDYGCATKEQAEAAIKAISQGEKKEDGK